MAVEEEPKRPKGDPRDFKVRGILPKQDQLEEIVNVFPPLDVAGLVPSRSLEQLIEWLSQNTPQPVNEQTLRIYQEFDPFIKRTPDENFSFIKRTPDENFIINSFPTQEFREKPEIIFSQSGIKKLSNADTSKQPDEFTAALQVWLEARGLGITPQLPIDFKNLNGPEPGTETPSVSEPTGTESSDQK